jgi:hypothetical protein
MMECGGKAHFQKPPAAAGRVAILNGFHLVGGLGQHQLTVAVDGVAANLLSGLPVPTPSVKRFCGAYPEARAQNDRVITLQALSG